MVIRAEDQKTCSPLCLTNFRVMNLCHDLFFMYLTAFSFHLDSVASKGNVAALLCAPSLYRLHREGQGPCPPYCQDFKAAYQHFDEAAAKGNVDALLFLGLMLKAGEYVERDCDRAAMALKQCAERGPWGSLLQQAFVAWNDQVK